MAYQPALKASCCQLKVLRRKDLMHFEKELDELAKKRGRALEMGGADKVKRQHDRGKLTARERIDRLLDPGSFLEVGMFNH
jgi:acetyl-CoA carboxylase carboxyltransferase component